MSSMSPSGLHVNKPVGVILVGVIVVGVVYFKMSGGTSSALTHLEQGDSKVVHNLEQDKSSSGRTSDIESVAVKHVVDLKVQVGGKVVTVAYRETRSDSAKLDILFLHGMAFKSETWVSSPVWMLQHLYKAGGFRAVAIDLPGFGDSPSVDVDHAAFLEAVIKALALKAPVIVSPSMSGAFALPYLFKDSANVLARSRAFVSVAPVNTEKYTKDQYEALKIPTLVIYGEKDKGIGARSTRNLVNLQDHKTVELSEAGHACYMDKPEEFRHYMLEFLNDQIKS